MKEKHFKESGRLRWDGRIFVCCSLTGRYLNIYTCETSRTDYRISWREARVCLCGGGQMWLLQGTHVLGSFPPFGSTATSSWSSNMAPCLAVSPAASCHSYRSSQESLKFFSVNFEGLIPSLQLHTWRSCPCSP